MSTIRKRLSYANVIATIALFVSLGGGAFAALRVSDNSVGAKQLKRNAVTGAKVRNASLTGVDVKDGSLTGADVKPRSLVGEDIKPGSLTPEMLPRFGLANLYGVSGTAINGSAIELKNGECGRFTFGANGAQPGDAVILQGSDIVGLEHAIEGGPTISNPNQLNVTVCADSEHAVNQAASTVQLRFDTLR
ncbi:MAG TPA: hypothetical protein VFK92_07765 [Burkholderiales bacterium]|nr:hypothetical protein [Burkholderiales bacterium]